MERRWPAPEAALLLPGACEWRHAAGKRPLGYGRPRRHVEEAQHRERWHTRAVNLTARPRSQLNGGSCQVPRTNARPTAGSLELLEFHVCDRQLLL